MRAWLRSSDGTVLAAGAAVAIAAAATLHVDQPKTFLAFAFLVAASEMFEVTLTNDELYTFGLAPGLSFALLGSDLVGSQTSLSEVLCVFALGAGMACIVRALSKEPVRLAESGARLLALGGAAGTYKLLQPHGFIPAFGPANAIGEGGLPTTRIAPEALVAMLVVLVLLETIVKAMRSADRDRIPLGPVFVGALRSSAALHLTVVSVGALLALSYPSLSYWAFPLFLAPLAATQFAFRQFASIRTTYLQTIRALSKVPELAGYTPHGHSRRVADLSVAIARELGVAEGGVADIEYAALLHDIGRVSVPEPEDVEYSEPRELAHAGATIVRQTGHFNRVADLIETQHAPYRARGEEPDPTLSVGSKIIKAASAFDDLTNPGGVGLHARDAMERLYSKMVYEYDPEVVGALQRVLEKRGTV
ncbi:MAG TPA: HD domain-containing protein [Actinomycetota bacterium]|nr:HD domain-containing protein [Actinomycetota bacterium]